MRFLSIASLTRKSDIVKMYGFEFEASMNTYVDLMVMHLSCSSFLVSVNLVSPARAEAMMPALHTRESVRVDLPWSTWAITDMFLMLDFLSMISLIWSTVKFTWEKKSRMFLE